MKPEIQYVLEYLDENDPELAAYLRTYIDNVYSLGSRLTVVVSERDDLRARLAEAEAVVEASRYDAWTLGVAEEALTFWKPLKKVRRVMRDNALRMCREQSKQVSAAFEKHNDAARTAHLTTYPKE